MRENLLRIFPDDDERWFPSDFSKPCWEMKEYSASYTSPAKLAEWLPLFDKLDYDLLYETFETKLDKSAADWQVGVLKQWHFVAKHCVENDLGLRLLLA